MGCWCGHGPWHHWGYGYPPPYQEYPSYPPPYEPQPYPGPARRRRGMRGEGDLEEYLERLEEEIGRVRRELQELRGAGEG